MRMPVFRLALMGLSALMLAGCGWFGGDKSTIVFDEAQGVDAKMLVKGLPNDLKGDEKNKRYLMSPMRAEEIAAEGEEAGR
ncbi:hypothetical protein CCR85_13195 [Rhodothalassium salexigens]|uniref:hypothetical protein n=1 Tax=Rhodothalassium salexigens TaxID=1086 RepID=UPI001911B6AD|nr:hypothetical protein [Rhodothalassium salexigens]MBK5912442.1 hypothetical protein [Rhodothalassium salexigens]MBK5919748.1 hypothetical protein [Rhodothalassium salexigens]